MKELKEIRFDGSTIILEDNLVKGAILPQKMSELKRTIIFRANTKVEGAIYAHDINVDNGDLEVQGAVFAQQELHINTDATGKVTFRKAVASSDSIVARAPQCQLSFFSDINAKSVVLYNAYVAGSIYADDVVLENCVVIGGVFATGEISLKDSIVGTFNTPVVKIEGNVGLLLPSAFSIEAINAMPGAKMYNYSLSDLGALYRGTNQDVNSGKIPMNIDTDMVKSHLVDEDTQKTLRSYSVIGKVLAADLLDTDKFQNHFLLTAASLGPQMLKVYNLGVDSEGVNADLTPDRIRDFFFDLLKGKIAVQDLTGSFSITDLTKRF